MDDQKRERILDAAVKVFSQHGFKQAAIDEIARQAGVAKGTVYLVFPSKEELFFEAVRRDLSAFHVQQSARVDPKQPADVQLEQASQQALRHMETHPLVLDLFVGLYHAQLPALAQRFETLRAYGRERVELLLRLGMSQGRFRARLPVADVAEVLLDMQVAIYIWQRRVGARATDAAVRRRLRTSLQLVLQGLLVPRE